MGYKLSKFCVFCGNKPEAKTKEHIIPQWLIKLTGSPNREIIVGEDIKHFQKTGESRLLKFSFTSFQFPACNACNNEFSQLEASSKNVIEKILSEDYISQKDCDILLDWFDKVRVGLWLGLLSLNRDDSPIMPKFHIKKRIGEKDRCLFIYEMGKDNWEGIQFTAINSPIFTISPSCFSLRINNYYFFNISYDFLFSKNIGFPYPKKQEFFPGTEEIYMQLVNGTEKIELPLLNKNFLTPSLAIYQPIIPRQSIRPEDNNEISVYENDFVKRNCLDYDNGKGSIFYSEGKRIIKLHSEEEICAISKPYDVNIFQKLISQQTVDFQSYLYRKLPSTERLAPEEKNTIVENAIALTKFQERYRNSIR